MVHASALVLLSATAGCQETDFEPEFGRIVSAGDHVEIWASPGVEVCGGNVAYLDAFVEGLRERVGPHPEAEDSRRYYVLNEGDWRAFDDAVDCRGCACTTEHRTVYSRFGLPSAHEMVHAELFSGGHRFLEEGIAVALGGPLFENTPEDYDVEEGLSEAWTVGEAYPRAGHFTRFLIDRHGIERFLAFKDASLHDPSYDRLSHISVETLGESLDELVAIYEREDADCRQPGYQEHLVECDGLLTPWSPTDYSFATEIEFETDFACEDGHVLGPVFDQIYVTRRFEVERPGSLYAYVDGGAVTIAQCDGSCDADEFGRKRDALFQVSPRTTLEESIRPGRYTMRIWKPLAVGRAPVRVHLTLFAF